MVVKTLSKSGNRLTPSEHSYSGGYAEVHQKLGVNPYDLPDVMIDAILGRETPEAEDSTEVDRCASLGQVAVTSAVLGASKVLEHSERKAQKLTKRLDSEKLTINPEDSRATKVKKKFGRAAFIAAAVITTPAVIYGTYHLVHGASMDVGLGVDTWLAADSIEVNSAPVTHDFDTVVIAGGRGDGTSVGATNQLRADGEANGYNVETVNYPAEIAPLDQTPMEASTDIGAADMYAKAIDDLNAGRTVHLIGYSEGSAVALETANRLLAEGVDPSKLNVTIIGSPYAQGGILYGDNAFANAASPILKMVGIPEGIPVPPGTRIVYYDTDFWANSGEQAPTTMLRQLVELGFGGHDIPDPNNPSYTFTDTDGVIHTVYSRNDPILQAMMNSGLQIADTATANRAINDLFPLDGSKPNVAQFQQDLADTLAAQPDPVSKVVANFVRSLPPEYAQMGQNAMDGFNLISKGAAKIGSGNLLGGWQDIMAGMKQITDGLHLAQHVVNENQAHAQAQMQQLLSGNVSGLIKQHTGIDLGPQLSGYVDHYAGELISQASSVSHDGNVSAQGTATANGNANFSTYLNQFIDTYANQNTANNSGPATATANATASASVQVPTPDGIAKQFAGTVDDTFKDVFKAPDGTTPNVADVTKPVKDAVNNFAVPEVSGSGSASASVNVDTPHAQVSGSASAHAETSAPATPAPAPEAPAGTNPLQEAAKRLFTPHSNPAPAPELPDYTAPTEMARPAAPVEAPAVPLEPTPAPAPVPVVAADPTPAPAPEAPAGNNSLQETARRLFTPRHANPAPAPVVEAPAAPVPSGIEAPSDVAQPAAPAPAAPATPRASNFLNALLGGKR